MEPKSIEKVPNWVIVNALRCHVESQISIVAKLLQHLDSEQLHQALRMAGVGGMFYCQRGDVTGSKKCENQCEVCKPDY